MFLAINYPGLRNNEFIQFFQNLLEIINANDPEALKVKSQYDDLHALVATMASFYKPELGSEITAELQELDAARDSALQGIEFMVKSYTYHYTDTKREAAELLEHSLDNYGSGITRLNYQAETSTINSIIEKWETEQKYIDALASLSLTEWKAELKTINVNFNQRYLDRLSDNADHPEQTSLDLRAGIITSYRELLAYLQAYTTLSTAGEYEKLNKLINELISEYNKMLAARKSKNEEISEQEENVQE